VLDGAGGVGVGVLDAAAGQAQLVELDAARLIDRKERARGELAIGRAEHARLLAAQDARARARLRRQQRREGDAEAGGDLPQHVDGGGALPELNLPEHGAADARLLRQLLQRQAALGAELAQVVADDGRQIAGGTRRRAGRRARLLGGRGPPVGATGFRHALYIRHNGYRVKCAAGGSPSDSAGAGQPPLEVRPPPSTGSQIDSKLSARANTPAISRPRASSSA